MRITPDCYRETYKNNKNLRMKKSILLFIILFISYCQIFSQETLLPLKSESFGLNHHTNRDISYFSHVDSNKNTIIVGTTERDSTFTDIVTTKLDENYNLLWQKRLSKDTDLSYDIPLKSFINSSNELYIIGKSSFNASFHNGLIFIVKYSENGDVIYNKTIGNIDGPDYVDYGYMDAGLNNDGSVSLVYSKFSYETYTDKNFEFLKINNQGDIISSFEQEIMQKGIIGIVENGNFYFLTKDFIDGNNPIYIYKFYKIQDENNQSSFEITDSDFLNYYENSAISDQVKLNVDDNGNCYLTCQNPSDNDTKEKINLSKIDTNNNSLTYSITSPNTENYFFIDSFINEQNENIIISNNINSNSIDFISVIDNNTLQTQSNPSNFLATGFKKNNDDTFFITTSNSNIRLFSNNLTELKSFNTSDTFELTDFSKIDNESITATGTSIEKMFPESDYYTQLDIKTEKINGSNILNNYSYSGIGTSRAFQQRVIIDNGNNYLVLVTEKMGPEYLGIGGQNPPLNNRIIKYDLNLNKLWEVEIPEDIYNIVNNRGSNIEYFLDTNNNLYLNLPRAGDHYGLGYDLYKVTPSGDFEFINNTYVANKFYVNETSIFMAKDYFLYEDSSKLWVLNKTNGNLIEEINVNHEKFLDFFSIGNDYYFYTYEEISNNTPDIIYLYKNGEKIFTRNLSNNYGIFPYEIDDAGTLFFVTENGLDRRMNKLDINNSYSYYNTSDDIVAFKKFNNGKIFIYLENYNTLILDGNLNFITNGEKIDSWNPYLMARGRYMLLGTSFENSIRIIDQNGNSIKYFKSQGFLHDWYSKFDKEENLVMVGQWGNRIYTFNEYGWYRGFIHKYKVFDNIISESDDDNDGVVNYSDACPDTPPGESVNEYGCAESQLDNDNDGVMNNLDTCPETPEGEIVNFNGCTVLPSNNFTIETISETCPDTKNGKLIISANTSNNYQLKFNNNIYNFSSNLTIENITPGTYEACIEVPNVTSIQCYIIEIKEGIIISGKALITSKKTTIEINKGTAPYNVFVNGSKVLETIASTFDINLKHGDFVEVKTAIYCEGVFAKTVDLLDAINAYPNPTKGVFEISLPISLKEVNIELYNICRVSQGC